MGEIAVLDAPARTIRTGPIGRLSRRIDYLNERTFAFLMFIPAVLLVALVALPPIGAVFGMSMFRIELLREGPTRFIGLLNFSRITDDANFVASIPRTVLFAAGTTVITVPLAVATAMLLNRARRSAGVLTVALLLPWAIAPIVTGFFWRFMFQPSFGIVTDIVRGLGITDGPVAWLQDPGKAMFIAILATAWRSAPLLALIILASLKAIPQSQYRAAIMDGATGWQAFRSITLPSIRNTVFIATILQIIVSLQVFDVLFQLTKGGPGFETTTVAYYIYQSAFERLSLGFSAALAVFLTVVIVIFSLLAALAGRRRRARPMVEPADAIGTGRLQLPATAPRAAGAVLVDATDPDPAADPAGIGPGEPEPPLRLEAPAPVGTPATVRDTALTPIELRPRRRILPGPVRSGTRRLAAALLIVWSAGPTLWILIASVQPESAITSSPLRLDPALTFLHYGEIFTSPEWISSFQVSLVVSVASALLSLVFGSLAAYPLARLRLPRKNLLLALLMFTYTVPALALAIPLLFVYNKVGLTDTVAGLIIANVAFCLPLAIWLLRNIFESVPAALEGAARMDGCSRLGTLFRITIPSAAPGIAATGLLLLISVWNEFLFAVVLGNHGAVTITRRIGYINSPTGIGGEPPYAYQAAAGVVAVLPVVLLVMIFHRRISSGLSDSYIKG
jgi:ABC-type sugar transport system permease subunit